MNAAPPNVAVLPVNLSTFRELFPRCPSAWAVAFLPYFNAACLEAKIDTPRRLAHFAAQLGHESGDLRWWNELGDGEAYDTGRLAVRLGNTPEDDGDGPLFKGRGPIQLTGRANYAAAGKALGVDLVANPERAAQRDVGFRVAAWYWTSRGLNALADAGDFVAITRRINGGENGIDDRRRRLVRAFAVLRCN
jgi:putative chitinase